LLELTIGVFLRRAKVIGLPLLCLLGIGVIILVVMKEDLI